MEITLSHFVLAVVFGCCVVVVALSAVSRFLHFRSEQRSLRRRVVCRLCLHAFEDPSDAMLMDCPVCHTPNERRKRPL